VLTRAICVQCSAVVASRKTQPSGGSQGSKAAHPSCMYVPSSHGVLALRGADSRCSFRL
jgi:hypothetical protein